MKTKPIICIAIAMAFSASAFSQTLDTSTKPMTLERAERLIPRNIPKCRSLIPGEGGDSLDTLDTSNPKLKIVLFNDGTWAYIKDGDLLKNESYFVENWNENPDAYNLDFNKLPDRVTLWLVDNVSQYSCPMQTKVYSPFGYRHRRRHQGVDLPLKTGDPVKAAFDGKVRMSKYYKGYGNLVVIRHENGIETFYGHLSKRNVEVGDWVTAGQIIGLGGSTGRSTGPHLHFETRYDGYAFDPQWIMDFEKGTLRNNVFTLKKKYLSASSRYVPESDDEEEEILLAEDADRAEAARKAAEEAAKQYYTIRSGDTLGKIAIKNHTTIKNLCRLNNIKETTILQIGRKLRVR